MATTTTCQICGRAIKANLGLIAHHGYKRPGDGWQTASCYGARWMPYEESCNAIQPAIDAAQRFIDRQQDILHRLVTDPPAAITRHLEFGRTISVARPADFSPERLGYDVHIRGSYAYHFKRRRVELEQSIKSAQADVEYLQARLDAWKPAE